LVEEKQGKKNLAALRLKRGARLDKIKGTWIEDTTFLLNGRKRKRT
jgi:hypothetical protein